MSAGHGPAAVINTGIDGPVSDNRNKLSSLKALLVGCLGLRKMRKRKMEDTENEGHERANSFSAERHCSERAGWSGNRSLSNQQESDLKEQAFDPMEVDEHVEEGEADSKL